MRGKDARTSAPLFIAAALSHLVAQKTARLSSESEVRPRRGMLLSLASEEIKKREKIVLMMDYSSASQLPA